MNIQKFFKVYENIVRLRLDFRIAERSIPTKRSLPSVRSLLINPCSALCPDECGRIDVELGLEPSLFSYFLVDFAPSSLLFVVETSSDMVSPSELISLADKIFNRNQMWQT